eukprot:GGOE01001284.1.p1 GENE.GGOE01001284.1~~GGOE01001284.1.p1  ORF type:complete len:614 (-),score=117.08 GGOE01001284.1:241-2082(-)
MKRTSEGNLYAGCSLKELQGKCRERGLKVAGRVHELIDRLLSDDNTSGPTDSVKVQQVQLSTGSAMETLLTKALFSDMIFIAGRDHVRIPAHRAVLAAHSEVLLAMLMSECEEATTGIVELPDFEPPVVRAFLRLSYCGCVPIENDLLLPVMKLCDLYQMQSQVDALARAIEPSLDTKTALKLFALGCEYHADSMRDAALQYIQQKAAAVFEEALANVDSGLGDCTVEQMQLLLGDDHLVVDEDFLWKVALKWAQSQGGSMAAVLEPLIPHLRWSLMTSHCLQSVAESGLVPSSVLLPYAFSCAGSTKHQPRSALATPSCQLPPGPLSLRCAHNAQHHVYVWQVPILRLGNADFLTPPFEVGGAAFSMLLRPEAEWLQAFLKVVRPGPTSSSAVFFGTSILRYGTLEKLDARKTGRDGLFYTTRGADWGWKKYLNLNRCCMEMSRLHGPGRDLLMVEIEVQVQGPFKLLAHNVERGTLKLASFDLTVPACALDCECATEIDACGRRWMVRVSGSFSIGRMSLAAVDENCRQAQMYEMECCLLHPMDDDVTMQTMRRMVLNVTNAENNLPSGEVQWQWSSSSSQGLQRSTFTHDHGGIVVRFTIRETDTPPARN